MSRLHAITARVGRIDRARIAELLYQGFAVPRQLSALACLGLTLPFLLFYAGSYAESPYRPGSGRAYPLGWYGWADQSHYIDSAQAFASGLWLSARHFYPPLYALFSSIFVALTPTHPHLLADAVLLSAYLACLFSIGARLYGPALAPLCVAVAFLWKPIFTVTQWVVPWTTSMSAALGAGMFAIFFRFGRSRPAFAIVTPADGAFFVGFFLLHGLVFPTRPLDFVGLLPVSAAFLMSCLLAVIRGGPHGRFGRGLGLVAAAGAAGLVGTAGTILFNWSAFGTMLGPYAASIGTQSYDVSMIPERAYSILRDSGVLYAEPKQALFQRWWLLAPCLAIAVVAAVRHADVRRWIVVCAILQVLLYLPYGDLLPNGLFRYFNLHYFKWIYPWLLVMGAGELIAWWSRGRPGTAVGSTVAAAALLGLIYAWRLVPIDLQRVRLVRTASPATVAIELDAARSVNYIDIPGVTGNFPDVYLGNHIAVIDGVLHDDKRVFRLLPSAGGVRFLANRTLTMKSLVLRPTAGVTVADSGPATVAAATFKFLCVLRDCAPKPPPDPTPLKSGS